MNIRKSNPYQWCAVRPWALLLRLAITWATAVPAIAGEPLDDDVIYMPIGRPIRSNDWIPIQAGERFLYTNDPANPPPADPAKDLSKYVAPDLIRTISEWTEVSAGKRSTITYADKEYRVTNFFGIYYKVVAYSMGPVHLYMDFPDFLAHKCIQDIEAQPLRDRITQLQSELFDSKFVIKSNVLVYGYGTITNNTMTITTIAPATNGLSYSHKDGWQIVVEPPTTLSKVLAAIGDLLHLALIPSGVFFITAWVASKLRKKT